MREIKATSAYFIKLGKGGAWEEECILHDNTIKLGFNNPLHSECMAGEWHKVHEYWVRQKREATKITNQIKAFYESDDDTIWITFFGEGCIGASWKRKSLNFPTAQELDRSKASGVTKIFKVCPSHWKI